MKSLMPFYRLVAKQVATWCDTSADLDLKTVEARWNTEGDAFVGIRLPDFCKDFERSLDMGFVSLTAFSGFARKGALPILFGGFLDQVFDRDTGLLLVRPSTDAIYAIRQLTLMFGKVALPSSQDKVDAALRKYVECENDVKRYDLRFKGSELEKVFQGVGRLLWTDLFTQVDRAIYYGEVVPKHGPGSTADKLRGNAKWNQLTWTARLEEIFPSGEYLIPNWRFLPELANLDIVEPGSELPAKVVTVPKTLKTPRIIAMEPTCMQYMQQGLLTLITDNWRQYTIASEFIDFQNQIPNQELAKIGSKDSTLATIDLSEASDRVSNLHVTSLLGNHPWFSRAVAATRSEKADVPGFGVLPLAKFASMGSALCFPFEAMVFLTVIFTAIQEQLKRPLTRKDILSFKGKVRVFGDDIIVPVDYVESVVAALETFGFKVNSSKSFWNGQFRESCGKEYYAGVDVSVVRIRQMFPTQRQHAEEIISTVATRNLFFLRGFHSDSETIRYLDGLIVKLGIPYPAIRSLDTPIIGALMSDGYYDVSFTDPNLHIPLVWGMVVDARIPKSELDGYGALMKCLLKNPDLPVQDAKHLLHAGRPVRVRIKAQMGLVG